MKFNSGYAADQFHESVKELANYLYVIRGCQKNRALEYWLEAEKRLKESLASDNGAPARDPLHFSN